MITHATSKRTVTAHASGSRIGGVSTIQRQPQSVAGSSLVYLNGRYIGEDGWREDGTMWRVVVTPAAIAAIDDHEGIERPGNVRQFDLSGPLGVEYDPEACPECCPTCNTGTAGACTGTDRCCHVTMTEEEQTAAALRDGSTR